MYCITHQNYESPSCDYLLLSRQNQITLHQQFFLIFCSFRHVATAWLHPCLAILPGYTPAWLHCLATLPGYTPAWLHCLATPLPGYTAWLHPCLATLPGYTPALLHPCLPTCLGPGRGVPRAKVRFSKNYTITRWGQTEK